MKNSQALAFHRRNIENTEKKSYKENKRKLKDCKIQIIMVFEKALENFTHIRKKLQKTIKI